MSLDFSRGLIQQQEQRDKAELNANLQQLIKRVEELHVKVDALAAKQPKSKSDAKE